MVVFLVIIALVEQCSLLAYIDNVSVYRSLALQTYGSVSLVILKVL